MSEASRDLLVVGSGLEAHLALHRLSSLEFGGKLLQLPRPVGREERFLFTELADWHAGERGPKAAFLLDIWGKKVLSLALPPLQQFEPPKAPPKNVEVLAEGLEINRTVRGEHGLTVSLTDGTDLVCQGVLYCDGPESGCRKFWDKPVPPNQDVYTVQCWEFSTENLLSIARWEFRWAIAKSVELVPLSQDRLRVRLRFKSRHGSALSTSELQDLFSEFGSDMTALFEGLESDQIQRREETGTSRAVHLPAPGCLALGRAAWSTSGFLTFDWLARFVSKQLHILEEQLRAGPLNEPSFEAQSQLMLEELSEAEHYCRRHLHSDNTMLIPLRNLLLTLLPNPLLANQIKKRLYS